MDSARLTVFSVAFGVALLASACSSGPTNRSAPAADGPDDMLGAAAPPAATLLLVDGRPVLAQDPRPAIQALARGLPPLADAAIVSVTEMTYGEAMCGLASYRVPHPEAAVWVVAVDAIWNPFPHPGPIGAKPQPAHRAIVAYVLDRQTGTSLQTFSPWPLARNPEARCAP